MSGSLACTVRPRAAKVTQQDPVTNKQAQTDVDDKIGLARNRLEERNNRLGSRLICKMKIKETKIAIGRGSKARVSRKLPGGHGERTVLPSKKLGSI